MSMPHEADLANDDQWLWFRFRLWLWPPEKTVFIIKSTDIQIKNGARLVVLNKVSAVCRLQEMIISVCNSNIIKAIDKE